MVVKFFVLNFEVTGGILHHQAELPLYVRTFLEYELSFCVACVSSHILLQVRVLVVVDTQTLPAEQLSHVLDQACFPC